MAATDYTIKQANALTKQVSLDFNKSYQNGLKELSRWVQPHTQIVRTMKEVVNFIFDGDTDRPTQRLQGDPITGRGALIYQWELGHDYYADSFTVPWEDWQTEEYGLLKQRASRWAEKYSALPRYKAVDILNDGETAAQNTYDGVPLYSNSHVLGEGTFDNLFAGTGDFKTDLETLTIAMMNFETDTGEKRLDNGPTHVVLPPGLHWVQLETLKNQWDARDYKNTENVTRGIVNPITEPLLTDANDWFAFRSIGSEKPFIQVLNPKIERTKSTPTLVSTKESIIRNGVLEWVIDHAIGMHPTHPHLHAKVVNA